MGFLDIFKRKKKQEVADIVESESDKIETGLNIVPSVDDESECSSGATVRVCKNPCLTRLKRKRRNKS